jgi:vacuolar-type H+-ATPase subunit E/Vma4
MNAYRTPEERAEQYRRRTRIQAILDQARTDATSLLAAMELNESPEVVETWINRLWNRLRDHLDGESRLQAIVMLIEADAHEAADELTGEVLA